MYRQFAGGGAAGVVIFVVAILPMLEHRWYAFAESGNAWPPSKDDKLSPRIGYTDAYIYGWVFWSLQRFCVAGVLLFCWHSALIDWTQFYHRIYWKFFQLHDAVWGYAKVPLILVDLQPVYGACAETLLCIIVFILHAAWILYWKEKRLALFEKIIAFVTLIFSLYFFSNGLQEKKGSGSPYFRTVLCYFFYY